MVSLYSADMRAPSQLTIAPHHAFNASLERAKQAWPEPAEQQQQRPYRRSLCFNF